MVIRRAHGASTQRPASQSRAISSHDRVSALFPLPDFADHPGGDRLIALDEEDVCGGSERCYRAAEELRDGMGLRRDQRGLCDLERDLEPGCLAQAVREHDEALRVGEPVRQRGDRSLVGGRS